MTDVISVSINDYSNVTDIIVLLLLAVCCVNHVHVPCWV